MQHSTAAWHRNTPQDPKLRSPSRRRASRPSARHALVPCRAPSLTPRALPKLHLRGGASPYHHRPGARRGDERGSARGRGPPLRGGATAQRAPRRSRPPRLLRLPRPPRPPSAQLPAIAERVAACAPTRIRLVPFLPSMARDARRAVVARRGLVGDMATLAPRMAGNTVQPRPAIHRVTRRARRRRRHSAGAMRAMTRRARDPRPMSAPGGPGGSGVAARARHRGPALSAMRLMAAHACLMAARRGARLGAVAGRARRRRRRPGPVRPCRMAALALGMTLRAARGRARLDAVARRARGRRPCRLVCRLHVARGARRVAGAGGTRGLAAMAARAPHSGEHGLAAVRRVAPRARRGPMAFLLVTALAHHSLRAVLQRVLQRVRRMTAHARPLPGAHRVRRALGMAPGTRLRHGLVRRVTPTARRMLRRRDHRLLPVAALAPDRLLLPERVRHMAPGAPRVASVQRRAGDTQRSPLPLVAALAPRIGHQLRLVHRVAVEAAPRTRVPRRRVLLVAARARPRLERGRLMRAVAVPARLIGVRADGDRVQALRSLVAAHAARRPHRQIRAEPMAILAPRRLRHADRIRRMQRRRRRRVAALADVRRRRGERRVAVAISTRHARAVDVHAVAGTVSHLAPHARHVRRLANRSARSAVAAPGDPDGDPPGDPDRDPDHNPGRDPDPHDANAPPHHRTSPPAWHIRHGVADSGCRLDQPGG